jgi:hypothetical protein
MNSTVPKPEKVLPLTADEHHASPHSYYQFLLRKCRTQHGASTIAANEKARGLNDQSLRKAKGD